MVFNGGVERVFMLQMTNISGPNVERVVTTNLEKVDTNNKHPQISLFEGSRKYLLFQVEHRHLLLCRLDIRTLIHSHILHHTQAVMSLDLNATPDHLLTAVLLCHQCPLVDSLLIQCTTLTTLCTTAVCPLTACLLVMVCLLGK